MESPVTRKKTRLGGVALRRLRSTVAYIRRKERLSSLQGFESIKDSNSWSVRRIAEIAKIRHAKTYLEIGVFKGNTLKSVPIPIRVGVDPFPLFNPTNTPPGVKVVVSTSDSFFRWLPRRVRFDVVFLDGLHKARQTLKDFWNAARHSNQSTVFLIDDVYPDSDLTAMPSQRQSRLAKRLAGLETSRWHGDVWKVLIALEQVFPEFSFRVVNSPGADSAAGEDNPQAVVWRTSPSRMTRTGLRKALRIIKRLENERFSSAVKSYPKIFELFGEDEIPRMLGR